MGITGGKIEPGESITQTDLREVLEETGLRVNIVGLLGVYSNPNCRIIKYPDNVVQIVDVLLEAEVISGKLMLSHESDDIKFFDPVSLPSEDEIVPPAREVLWEVIHNITGVIR